MKKVTGSTLLLGIILHFTVLAQEGFLQLTDIWSGRKLIANKVTGFRPMNDGRYYSKIEKVGSGQAIVQYEFKTGKVMDTVVTSRQLITGKDSLEIGFYQFNKDESEILLSDHVESIYRHSTKADYYLFNRTTKAVAKIESPGKIMYAEFSPQGDKVSYVRENNLYIYDLRTKQELAVTSDGKKNEIINGATDWVYEEEFAMDVAYQWSPDGKKIGYLRFDESRVKEVDLTYYGDLYPRVEKYKYPKAGEENSKVTLFVYDVAGNRSVQMKLGDTYEYLPRIKWTLKADTISVQRLNRKQNNLDLLFCSGSTGEGKLVLTQKSTSYVEVTDDLYFLKNGKQFIWTNSDDGYNHIYLYNLDGSLVKQITKGEFEVTKFYGYDDVTQTCFFQSNEVSPIEKAIYAVGPDGVKTNLTPESGTHQAAFSNDFSYFVDTYSQLGKPYRCTVNDNKGNQLRTLDDNHEVVNELKKYRLGKTSFFKFKTEDQTELYGWMIKPPDFDSIRVYPVLFYVYGGPHSQYVTDSWGMNTSGSQAGNYLWSQYMAQRGYVVVCVDNRGTPGRGSAFANCIYKNMGAQAVKDQLSAVRYIEHLSWVDYNRIGIWGWSFGGYLTSLLMTKTTAYKMGIAVAPVTNWRFYDDIYTERFLQTPQENPNGYDDNSPLTFAKNLNGKFMLVQGGADDNVHLQNTMDFINALVKANKQFDLMIYPNRSHGITGDGARLNLYTKMSSFILNNL